MQEDDVMELTWRNGQIVVHRPPRPPLPSHPPPLYIHEEEMATWLPQPIDDVPLFHQDFTSDLLYPPASFTEAVVTDSTPESRHHPPPNPEPLMIRTESDSRAHRFGHFSSFMPPGHSIKESASVVESNTTPLARESEVGVGRSGGFVAGSSSVGVDGRVETMSFDLEPLASGDVQKRKDREAEEAELPSQEFDEKAADTNKQARAPTAKRTRAAEIHNLSERKRRDRINEKMKALQELIPRCNKSDKASMLDDAFEYLKSLQMQVQMMSMGCGVMPMTMMFPGLQQYMQPMGMGMRLGIDMNPPMMPFPLATPNHLSPRFSVPSYLPSSSFMPLDASFIQVSNPASTLTPARIQNANQPQVQTTPDQYLYQPTQMQPSQIYPENPENPLPG